MGSLLKSAILALIVASSLNCSSYEMKCPEKSCICKVANGTNNITHYISQCSNSSLSDLPQGLDPHTSILNVSHNNITRIRNASDYEEGVLHIDRVLSKYTHEEGFEDGVLKSLSSLKELHLESNLLAEIEPGALDGNQELSILNLRDNNLTDLPIDVIELDNNIHEIDVSENGIEIIDMSLVEKYFPELRKFDVSRNQLKHIISISPDDGSVLEIFDASNNYIVDLSDAFVNATKLKEVNVSNNEITELSPDVFRDNPNLLSVDVSRNHIICIHKDVFSNLKKIVEIHAGSNKMTFIDPDTFRNNPDLTELTVSWNNIEEIHPKTFKNNPNLEYVNFRSNKIKSLSSDTFNDNPKLKSIDLRSNSLVTIERGTFLNNPQLEHLLLSKNEHVRFHDGFKIHSTVLKVFDVEHCNLTNMPAGILEEANSLKELNLANNNLTSLENITDGYSETMTELEILDLSNNNLQTITIDVFSNKLTKLKELRIAGNAFLCNCTLRTLWLWAQKQGLVPAEPQIMCSTGMNIIAWDELRNYNCSSEALMETDESLPLTNIIVDSKPSNSFINLPSEKQPENNKSLSHPSSGLIKEHKYHPQNKTEHAIDEYHGHEDEFYDFEDSVQDIGRSNRIMIGISLSILLVVVFIIIPVIFIMRRKNGLYKITKPMKKPFDAGATEQKSAFTAPPAI